VGLAAAAPSPVHVGGPHARRSCLLAGTAVSCGSAAAAAVAAARRGARACPWLGARQGSAGHDPWARPQVAGSAWFGGGCDLTPAYLHAADARAFHAFWRRLCALTPVACHQGARRTLRPRASRCAAL